METVIFDLDGTLADTAADLVAAANACFRELGLGPLLDPVADAGVALRGGKRMLREGFARTGSHGEDEVGRQYPRLLTHYGAAIATHSAFYPGALAAVGELRSAGYRLGICTNKPEALAHRLLAALDATDLFDSVVGADTLQVRKPDPLPLIEAVRRAGGTRDRACLVGDSDTDRATARAAGVPSILVTFGPAGDDMAGLAPEALLHRFEDLPEVVRRLVGSPGARDSAAARC